MHICHLHLLPPPSRLFPQEQFVHLLTGNHQIDHGYVGICGFQGSRSPHMLTDPASLLYVGGCGCIRAMSILRLLVRAVATGSRAARRVTDRRDN